jgi:Fe-Mn family superoxide dismutase
MDVWEHAYLLDFKTERPKYITAFFSNINWRTVESRLKVGAPLESKAGRSAGAA